jgi:hypothetical protein
VTVDTGGAALLCNGSRWSSEQMVSRKIKFTSISCPTVNFCVAAGLNDIPIGTAAYVATYTAPS